MPYDEQLAERIRRCFRDEPELREVKMFSGLAFMVGEHMACCLIRPGLMLRLGEDGAEVALRRPHIREMDLTGRPMATIVIAEPEALRGAALARWVNEARAYVATLPPKPPRRRPTPYATQR